MVAALSAAAMGLAVAATPAQATLTLTNPCSATTPDPDAIACTGYYSGNLLNGSAEDLANQTEAISALLGTTFTVDQTLWNTLQSNGDVVTSLTGGLLSFNDPLSGQVVIGVHFGDAGTGFGDRSVFYLFDFSSPVTGIALNDQGFSNAVLYVNGAVPEPATWSLMLLGFVGTGLAIRRSRRRRSALMQIA
jgi:hypothetical protein